MKSHDAIYKQTIVQVVFCLKNSEFNVCLLQPPVTFENIILSLPFYLASDDFICRPHLRTAVFFKQSNRMAEFPWNKVFDLKENEIVLETFTRLSMTSFQFGCYSFKAFDEATATRKQKIVNNLKKINSKCSRIGLLLMVLLAIAFAVFDAEDLAATARSLQDAMSFFLFGFKAALTVTQKKKILAIFEKLKSISQQRLGANEKYKVKRCLDSYHRVMLIYAGSFALGQIAALGLVALFAINGTKHFPMNYWFPFNEFNDRYYLLAMFFIDWNMWNIMFLVFGADSLLFALMTFASLEFDALSVDLKESVHQKTTGGIKTWIERHNTLMNVVDEIQSIYGIDFLLNVRTVAIVLCMSVFLLTTTTTDLVTLLFNIAYVAILTARTFLLCNFGQKLIDSSSALSDEAYDCEWEELPGKDSKKTILMILQRAQRSKQLTAMAFAEISHETFTTVNISRISIILIYLLVVTDFGEHLVVFQPSANSTPETLSLL